LRVVIPARQRAIHRKVRVRAQADRNWHTSFQQWFQSMSGLAQGTPPVGSMFRDQEVWDLNRIAFLLQFQLDYYSVIVTSVPEIQTSGTPGEDRIAAR